jgi:hypothetical protein
MWYINLTSLFSYIKTNYFQTKQIEFCFQKPAGFSKLFHKFFPSLLFYFPANICERKKEAVVEKEKRSSN